MKEKNRRKKQLRNLYGCSLFDRRKPAKNGGYLKECICPECGRAIVENGELCQDCNKIDEKINRLYYLFF